MQHATLEPDLPIFDTKRFPIGELNDAFVRFNNAYHALDGYFNHQADAPDYVKKALGTGILPSFDTVDTLSAMSAKHRLPPTRVGAAVHMFHTVMRNTAKKWGAFDMSKLDPEFRSVLDYLIKAEAPHRAPDLKCPEILWTKTGPATVDYLIEKFAALDAVPIVGGKSVPNTGLTQKRGFSDVDDGADTIEYTVPMAAVFWGIRHAGMSIKGRPEASPLRLFLLKAIGTADDAGLRMSELHEWAPDLCKDYDRKMISQSFMDQKYWIKVAYGASAILNRAQVERQAFAGILDLIGEDAANPNFKSASKIAILLHAIAERLEAIKSSAVAADETDSQLAKELGRRLETTHSGLNLDQAIAGLKVLSQRLSPIGEVTEKALESSKRDDSHHRPLEKEFYDSRAASAMQRQQESMTQLFSSEPELLVSIEAAREFAHALKASGVQIDNDAMRYIDAATIFCRQNALRTYSSTQTIGLQ